MTAGSVVVVVVEVEVEVEVGVELSLTPDGTRGAIFLWVFDRHRLRRSVGEAEHTYFFPFEAIPTRPEFEQNAPGVTGDQADATATTEVEPTRTNRATTSNFLDRARCVPSELFLDMQEIQKVIDPLVVRIWNSIKSKMRTNLCIIPMKFFCEKTVK